LISSMINQLSCCFVFSWGKRIISRMDCLSENSITKRSIPTPRPPVGGMPYSIARRKSSSITSASGSLPPYLASISSADCIFLCSWKRSLCSTGSLSSVKALANSRPQIKASKRSTRRSLSRFLLARGDISAG
jgi:hypothetical protein